MFGIALKNGWVLTSHQDTIDLYNIDYAYMASNNGSKEQLVVAIEFTDLSNPTTFTFMEIK